MAVDVVRVQHHWFVRQGRSSVRSPDLPCSFRRMQTITAYTSTSFFHSTGTSTVSIGPTRCR